MGNDWYRPRRRIAFGLGEGIVKVETINPLDLDMDAGQANAVSPAQPAVLLAPADQVAFVAAEVGPLQFSALAFASAIDGLPTLHAAPPLTPTWASKMVSSLSTS